MHKKIFTILIIFSVLFFAVPTYAQSPDDLEVIFNPNPLFSQTDFAPGQSATGLIEIKNKSGQEKQIAIESVNVNDPDNFGDVLDLQIWEAGQNYFNNSLTEFFNAGEVSLSNLANNASATYKLIITFNSEIDDDWQGKTLNNFDILIGFQGEDKEQVNGSPSASSGSSSGGGLPAGLSITDESVHILETNERQAIIITWLTNYLSTSQVIYSAENEPHILNLDALNFGYAHSSVEDLDKVTFHTVTLTGLMPGTTYYYRTVSRASPPTISREYSFVTKNIETQKHKNTEEEIIEKNKESNQISDINYQEREIPEFARAVAGEKTAEALIKNSSTSLSDQNFANLPVKVFQQNNFKKYWWLGLVLLIIILIYFFIL